jgi:dihydrofolate reductase
VRVSVFIATSLDGYIARADGGLDWLPSDGGEPHGYDEFIATVDAIVIGRKTLETVLAYPIWPYENKLVVALSTTLSGVKVPNGAVCEVISGSPQEIVARLESRGLKHIYVDGGKTIQGFLKAGLIQQLTITRVPVLLGAGIPLFGVLPHDIHFEHLGTHSYSSGLVKSEYRVIP